MSKKKIISDKTKKSVIKKIKEGINATKVANLEGLSRKNVYNIIKEFNSSVAKNKDKIILRKAPTFLAPKTDDKTVKKIIDLYSKNKNYTEISRVTNVCTATVKRVLKRNDIELRATKGSKSIVNKGNIYKSPNKRTAITNKNEKQVIAMYKAKKGIAYIKNMTDLSKPSIYKILKKFNIKLQKNCKEDHIKKIIELRKKGFAIRKIAKKIGKSYTYVYKILKEHKSLEDKKNDSIESKKRIESKVDSVLLLKDSPGIREPETKESEFKASLEENYIYDSGINAFVPNIIIFMLFVIWIFIIYQIISTFYN